MANMQIRLTKAKFRKCAYRIIIFLVIFLIGNGISFTYADIINDLVGHWTFDEGVGSIVNDSAKIAGKGTVKGSAVWIEGKVGAGKALYFDGVSTYITIPYNEEIYSFSSKNTVRELTVSAWIKTEDFGSVMDKRTILSHGNGISPNAGWNFTFEPTHISSVRGATYDIYSGHMHVDYRDTASTYQYIAPYSVEMVQGNNWHHVVFVYDSSNAIAKVYLNGQVIGEDKEVKNGILIDPANILSIGALPSNVSRGTFHGAIDDIRLYKRALSDHDVLELYQAHVNDGKGDIVPPSGVIESPVKNQKVSGVVKIAANVFDNPQGSGIAGVQFKQDGFEIGEEIIKEERANIYSVLWDTTQVPNGSHLLTAHVRDVADNKTSLPWVYVNVQNQTATIAPVITDVRVRFITADSAIVTWMTDQPASGQVSYGLTEAYSERLPTDAKNVKEHAVLLRNLSPNKKYFYQVRSVNAGGVATSLGMNFMTTAIERMPRVFNVDASGLDDFMTIQSCANVVSSGDTCLVASGYYPEHVIINVSGNPSTLSQEERYVVFRAKDSGVTMNGFDVNGSYVQIEGFDITGYDSLWVGMINISPGSNYVKVLNNTIRDGRYVGGIFDINANGTIYSEDVDFLAAGFKKDMAFIMGRADDKSPIVFGRKTIFSVSKNMMVLNESPLNGPQTLKDFALLFVNVGGINFQDSPSKGKTTSYCEVRGNKLYNLMGPFMTIQGSHHVIEGNEFYQLNGWDVFRIFGNDNIVRKNYVHDGKFVKGIGNHPDFVQTFADAGGKSYNNLFEYNFVNNLEDYQVGQLNSGGVRYTLNKNFYNIIFRHNVFANMGANWNVDVPGTQLYNNTFYRTFKQMSGIYIGGSLTRGSAENTVIVNNLFIETGSMPDGNGNLGFYTVSGQNMSTEVIINYVTKIDGNKAFYAKVIFDDLLKNGYININGLMTDKARGVKDMFSFTVGSDVTDLLVANLGNNYKFFSNAVYRLLKQHATYALPVTTVDIADFVTHDQEDFNLASLVLEELKNKGYVDNDGFVLATFNNLKVVLDVDGNVSSGFVIDPSLLETLKNRLGNNVEYFRKSIYHVFKKTVDIDILTRESFINDYNFITTGEINGFKGKSKFSEKNGINGGDPIVQNMGDLVGALGTVMDQDDGLVPLANSPACYAGIALDDYNKPRLDAGGKPIASYIGAYPCKGCVDSMPVAYFTMDKNNDYEPLIINFDASKSQSCGASLSYHWDFGDGTTAQGEKVTRAFSAGTKNVVLTVTNNSGKKAEYSKTVVVFPVLVPNLVFYLPMEGNLTDLSNRMDSSGKKNIGSWTGTENYGSGKFGQAISLSSDTSAYVSFVPNDVLDGMENLTISVWAKKTTSSSKGMLLTTNGVYGLAVSSIGMSGFVKNANQEVVTFNKSVDNDDTNWHHYALVYDGTVVKWYFNGAVVPCQQPDCVPRALTGSIANATAPTLIGIDVVNRQPAFGGLIDEVQIYNRALNADEIALLSKAKNPLSDNGQTESLVLAGDVSGDGKITVYDAALIVRYTLGRGLTSEERIRADYNKDGKFDAADIAGIARRSIGM